MDIWDTLYEQARALYHPEQMTPFLYGYHVACALETATGRIFTGFCIESCCGVMDLCAERVAALHMLLDSGERVVRRILVVRDAPPTGGVTGMPCGACREFFLQLAPENRAMEILVDYASRDTVTLGELMPAWWGEDRCRQP